MCWMCLRRKVGLCDMKLNFKEAMSHEVEVLRLNRWFA